MSPHLGFNPRALNCVLGLLRLGPGIDFRKFLWKFDGLGDRPFPEISLEIWGLGGKFGGWGWGGVKFTEPTGRNDMKIAFLRHFEVFLPSKMGCDQDLD